MEREELGPTVSQALRNSLESKSRAGKETGGVLESKSRAGKETGGVAMGSLGPNQA